MKNQRLWWALACLLLVSCGTYFSDASDSSGNSELSPLAIRGGGYLSTDTANEITPFIFVDPLTSNRVLLYSSDQDGTYDIYYTRMNEDGTFEKPLKHNLSTAVNEISPVLMMMVQNANTNYIFIYISIDSTNSTNIFYHATNNLDILLSQETSKYEIGSLDLLPSRLGILYDSSWSNRLLLYYHENTLPDMLSSSSFGNWSYDSISYYNDGVDHLSGTFFSFDPSSYNSLASGTAVNALIETTNSRGRSVLAISLFNSFSLYTYAVDLTNLFSPAAYQSAYNDREPSVDPLNYQVYFSSDRSGNFDLYRYNISTFQKVSGYPSVLTDTNYANIKI